MLPNGRYAIRYANGFRVLWIHTAKRKNEPKFFFGKRILFARKNPKGWTSFAFLGEGNKIQLFRKFAESCTPQQLEGLRSLVAAVSADPQKALALFEETDVEKGTE